MLKLRKKKRLRFAANARLLKLDPTRTLAMRRAFAARLRRKFAILKGKIVKLVLVEDAFGLRPRKPLSHFIGNVFCPTGEGGGVDPSCSPGSSIPVDKYAAGLKGADILHLPVAEGIKEGPSCKGFGDCTNQAYLEYKRSGADVYHGYVTYRDVLERAEGEYKTQVAKWGEAEVGPYATSFQATAHAWNVKDGKIVDRALGSEDAAKRVYFGKKIPKETLDKMKHGDEIAGLAMNRLLTNTRWQFADDEAKLTSFKRWVKTQIDIDLRSQPEEELWRRYSAEGYKKGQMRVYEEVNKARKAAAGDDEVKSAAYDLAAKDAVRKATEGPAATEAVRRLAARSFNEMDDVTTRMATKMTRALADGLVQQKSPRQIAQDLVDETDIEMNRAMLIARTEISRAVNEGILDAAESEGVTEVGVAVEWMVGDNPCPECEPLEGVVLSIDEARGMLPRHPGCMCAYEVVTERDDDMTTGRRAIERAIGRSQRAGNDAEDWGPAADITKERPLRNEATAVELLNRFLANAFCPTGEGGGIDPTCSPSGSGWTKEFAQGEMESLSAESGIRFKMIGSVATKGTSKHDLDVLRVGKHKFSGDPHPAIAAALEKMGYSYEGQQVHSGRDFETEGKQFDKGFSEMHTLKHPSGRKIEVWTVLKD